VTDRWAVIDEDVLHQRVVPALVALREEFGYSMSEAIEAFNHRYMQLRETRPQEFTVSREDYGQGVYT
jgi:hypothetical protein